MSESINKNDENIIVGRNPVMEAMRSGREIDKLFIMHASSGGSILPIIEKARALKIPIKEVSKQKLDFMCGGAVHQGVAALIAARSYCEIEDILKYAKDKNEDALVIICDGIEDPHNLGAIIRTAEAAGAHGIIIPKNRSVSLNATVAKASSGALMHVNICRVTNLNSAIDTLKQSGLWIYGADMDGETAYCADLTGPAALVIGSEGHGISRLTKEKCDVILSLPMHGQVNSLNASVAAGVLMYEFVRQRNLSRHS